MPASQIRVDLAWRGSLSLFYECTWWERGPGGSKATTDVCSLDICSGVSHCRGKRLRWWADQLVRKLQLTVTRAAEERRVVALSGICFSSRKPGTSTIRRLFDSHLAISSSLGANKVERLPSLCPPPPHYESLISFPAATVLFPQRKLNRLTLSTPWRAWPLPSSPVLPSSALITPGNWTSLRGPLLAPVQYLLPSIIPRLALCGWITAAPKFCVKKLFPRRRPLEGIYERGASTKRSVFQSFSLHPPHWAVALNSPWADWACISWKVSFGSFVLYWNRHLVQLKWNDCPFLPTILCNLNPIFTGF